MSARIVRPAGYAATAAEFLDEAAEDDGKDVAVRQLAALQAIGYALLALGEQLADVTDAVTGVQEQVADVAGAIGDLAGGEPPAGWLVRAAASGAGKSTAIRRCLADFFRRHPGAEVRVISLKREA
jgi:hypothetical protein